MSTWRRASTRRSTIRGRSRYATSLRGRGSFARHNLTVVPQIDDALKLFQAALKLHAQGPRSYEEASEAYDTLFASAIFKYPEASTEYERAERQPDPVLALETSFTEALEAANAEADGSGSSLPQALYLAYKNHGQFALDRIRHRVRRAVPQPPALFEAPETLADAHQALDDFDAALDRDPADAELWRRTARVAAFLKSARIERYCLEAAIELDDDPAVVEVEPPSLAEGFAGEQLKQQLQMLSDDIALSHPVMGPYLKQHMAAALRRYLDPLPWLPDPTKGIALVMPSSEGASPTRLVVSVPSPTWAELGMGLVRLVNEMGLPGQALVVKMPGIPDQVLPTKMEVDEEETQSSGQVPMIMDRVLDSPAQETPEEEAKEKGAPNGEAKESNDTSNADEPPKEKDSQAERSASQLARKRSQSAAGLPDQGDEENGDTKRSKRIRRRETAAAAAEEAVDPNTLFATQLQPYQAADQNLFQMTKNILENFGVSDRVTLDRLSETIDPVLPRIEHRNPATKPQSTCATCSSRSTKVTLRFSSTSGMPGPGTECLPGAHEIWQSAWTDNTGPGRDARLGCLCLAD